MKRKFALRKLFSSLSDQKQALILKVDHRILNAMHRFGHSIERWALGLMFFWFGALKVFGQESASSIIAKTIYWVDPVLMVPILGLWELVIGICVLTHSLRRFAVFLLLIRLPGTCLAMFMHVDICFDGSIFLPSIQGQYLIKELTLFGAALAIGATLRKQID